MGLFGIDAPYMEYQPSENLAFAMQKMRGRLDPNMLYQPMNQATVSQLGQMLREGQLDLQSLPFLSGGRMASEMANLRTKAGGMGAQMAGQNMTNAQQMVNQMISQLGQLGLGETEIQTMIDQFNEQSAYQNKLLPLQMFSSLLSTGLGFWGNLSLAKAIGK